MSPSTGLAQYEGYDRYEAAGAPPLNRLLYDRGSSQWGYWSVPGGEPGYEMGADDPQPLSREGLRVRRSPRPAYESGVNYGYTDNEELPLPTRARRPRRSATRPPLDIPMDAADESAPWSPRSTNPGRQAPGQRPAKGANLPESDAVPSAVSVRRRGEPIPAPQSQLEARCDTCTDVAGAIGPTPARTSNEILKAVDRKPKRTREVEEAEEREYDAIEEKSTPSKIKQGRTTNKFVERLLRHAAVEANKRVRVSGGRTRRKHSLTKGMGLCLQGVRMALQKTTGRSLNETIGDGLAKHAGPALVRDYGYTRVSLRTMNPHNAPEGSILIYEATDDRRKAGHIEIKGNGGFLSDYFNELPINELMRGRRRLVGIYTPPAA